MSHEEEDLEVKDGGGVGRGGTAETQKKGRNLRLDCSAGTDGKKRLRRVEWEMRPRRDGNGEPTEGTSLSWIARLGCTPSDCALNHTLTARHGGGGSLP